MTLKTALVVGSGGFIGAILRMYFTGVFNKVLPWHHIAIGTLGVNIMGSFLMGGLFAFFSHTELLSPATKSFLSTGILGALTTYSTFALESFIMLQHGQYSNFIINITANVAGTIIAVAIGYTLFTYWIK